MKPLRSSAGRCAALSSILLLVLAAAASAAEPQLSAIRPIGVQTGTEVELKFTGARLGDAAELLFYEPGVTVASFEVVKDNEVKAILAVAPECRVGLHGVRLRTATGVSNLLTFSVGALPIVDEVEPNNDFTAPQEIPLGVTVHGVVTTEDVDYFVVEAQQGDRITAELEGLRLGLTFFDPYLAILNEKRFELARSDDAALLRQDPVCSIIAPETGRYIIEVRESAFGGDNNSLYRLHVGKFPRPRGLLPSGGRPGETLEVTWLGDAAGPRTQQVTLPTDGRETFEFFAEDEHGRAPSPNLMRVLDLPSVVESEPNDAREQATEAVVPGVMHGVIGVEGEVDFYKFTAAKGATYDIRVVARNVLRSPLDSVLSVHRSNGAQIAANDDTGGPDSYLRFAAPDDGEYLLQIRDHLGKGGESFAYAIEATPVAPALATSLPERTQYVATTLTAPRGNRMAVMVGVRRTNFGGDAALEFGDLPPGVTVETVPLAGGRSDVPVLFSVAADAAPAGALVDVRARATDPNVSLVGGLQQRTMLVRGQNNRDVWGHDADRMALVVAETAPFEIEIVQPRAPLVRNGSLDLKVVARRQEGFTAPINVRLLYNPPGVSSSASIAIAEGQTEAVIPLTANGNAGLGVWKIVALGRAGTSNGAIETATQLADLEVADSPFNFAFQKAAAEQGQTAAVVLTIEQKVDFEGEAQATLHGLPPGATTEPVSFTKDAEQVVFQVQLAGDAKVGRHTSLACRGVVLKNGEPITYTVAGGELRIDEPLPMKPAPAAPVATAAPAAQPAAPAAAPVKRLSRLEMLRLQKQQEQEQGAP